MKEFGEFMLNWWAAWLFGIVATALICYVHGVRKKQRAFETGLQALLRADLVRSYDKYLDRGSITLHGLESVNLMYESYHALGGNGAITTLMEYMGELPVITKIEEKKL